MVEVPVGFLDYNIKPLDSVMSNERVSYPRVVLRRRIGRRNVDEKSINMTSK